MTIKELKQEARKETDKIWNTGGYFTHNELDTVLDTLIDKVVDAVEKNAPGDYWTNYEYDPEYEKGWNDYRKELLEAFRNFRGV